MARRYATKFAAVADVRIEVRAYKAGGWIVGVRYGSDGVYARQWKRARDVGTLRRQLDEAAAYRHRVAVGG